MRLRTVRRRGEGDEDGARFLRRPAASFDPSLIIVVSIELIATLALARRLFDRSRFFNPLLVPLLLPFSPVRAALPCTRTLLRRFLAVPRGPWKCNVGPRVSLYRSRDSRRARERNALFSSGEDSSIIPTLRLARYLAGFHVNLNVRKTLVGATKSNC